MLSEESYRSDHNIVISVEEDGDQSKTDMSVKGKHVNKDKFIPQNPNEAKSGLTPLESSSRLKETKVEVEEKSEFGDESEYKDDFEDDKLLQSETGNENSGKANTNKSHDNNSITVNGYEQTEIATEKESLNDTGNDKNRKPIDYQDTDYEIEEDIFSEEAEMLKDTKSIKDMERSKATEVLDVKDDNCADTGEITNTQAEDINTELHNINVGFKATSKVEPLVEEKETQSDKETHQNTISGEGYFDSSIHSKAVKDIEDEQTVKRDDMEEVSEHIETPERSQNTISDLKDVNNDDKKGDYIYVHVACKLIFSTRLFFFTQWFLTHICILIFCLL